MTTAAAYLIALATIVFWPEHVDAWAARWYPELIRSAPSLFPFGVDATLNVILFLPFGGLLNSVLPRRPLSAIGLAWVTSLLIEIAQGLFLPGRTSSAIDVAANTLGAALGYAATALVRWQRRERSKRRLTTTATADSADTTSASPAA
jgi:glycopeptide antibiotics resistance protein